MSLVRAFRRGLPQVAAFPYARTKETYTDGLSLTTCRSVAMFWSRELEVFLQEHALNTNTLPD